MHRGREVTQVRDGGSTRRIRLYNA